MNWRCLFGQPDPDERMALRINELTVEAGTLAVERDAARRSVSRLQAVNAALADTNVQLAHNAEVEELLCEEASFWLMTLPIASAQHYHQIHGWLARCDTLLHPDQGQPTE